MTGAGKGQLRVERLAARDAIADAERRLKSLAIADRGEGAIAVAPGMVVSGFLPIRSEPDVELLMRRLREKGARLCVPAIPDRRTMVFREYRDGTVLVPGPFGTREPDRQAVHLVPEIMLVPLAAFDARGNRIGYGAGHYDRAVAGLRQKGLDPLLIGIAFDCQEVASVPAEAHDIGLDAVLTESGYRGFSARAKIG